MPQLRAIALAITVGFGLLTFPGVAGALPVQPLDLDPKKGPPGSTVKVTPSLNASPGGCVAFWDSQEVARFTCGVDSGGFLSTDLTVPATAAPGQHTITVCRPDCGGIDPGWAQSAPFAVLAVVPDLGKLHLPEARSQLKSAFLTLRSVQGPADDPTARIVSQDPTAGTAVDPGSGVNVTVAVSPPVTVPDLRGRTRTEAEALATRSRLVLRVRSGSGRVDGQEPQPGSEVPAGSVVTVTLDARPQPVLVTVPDLRGDTRVEAEALATRSRLVLRVRSGSGRVDGQEPQPGRQVPAGSVVTVTLDASPQPVLATVPDLRGSTWAEAESAVRVVGLVLQSERERAGTVQAQSPPPGTRVRRGSTVTVTMAVPTATPDTTPIGTLRPMTMFAGVALILALAALVTSTLRSPRRRRSHQWVRHHVRVLSRATLSETVTSATGPEPSRRVGLEPHPDHGNQTLEEAHR